LKGSGKQLLVANEFQPTGLFGTPYFNFCCSSVREEAVLLIGNMGNVSEEMLEQTLDKKLMSNMRVKKSQHERNASMVSAGEWSSGELQKRVRLFGFSQTQQST
jgi:hypothetical protein